MIKLARISGQEFYLNDELIEQIETTPDTVITLSSGKTVMVKESPKQIVSRIVAFRGKIIKSSRRVCITKKRKD